MGYETWETTLTCKIFAYPPPKIEWTRSFRPLPVDRHVVTGKDLVIKDTQRKDKGPFMCRGENHLGHVYALIVLVVNPVREWGTYFHNVNNLAVFKFLFFSQIFTSR